jgi:hypothetical protein
VNPKGLLLRENLPDFRRKTRGSQSSLGQKSHQNWSRRPTWTRQIHPDENRRATLGRLRHHGTIPHGNVRSIPKTNHPAALLKPLHHFGARPIGVSILSGCSNRHNKQARQDHDLR